MPLISLFRRHTRIRELLDAFVDGELGPADAARVEAHLPVCAPCREAVAATRALKASFAALPETPAPRSFRLTPAMVAQPAPPLPRPASPGFIVIARFAAAASVAAFAVVGTLSLTSNGSTGDHAPGAGGIAESADFKATDSAATAAGDDDGRSASTADVTVPAIASPPGGGGVSGAGVPSPEPFAGAATPSGDRNAGPDAGGTALTAGGEEQPPADSLALAYDATGTGDKAYAPWAVTLGGLSVLMLGIVAALEIRRRRT